MIRYFGVVLGICFLTASAPLYGQNSLTIGDGSAGVGETAVVDILMTNPENEVEGFELAIAYDTSALDVVDVSIMGTITEMVGAEVVAPEIFDADGGFTLGVVLDFNSPFDGQTIPLGSDQVIATFEAGGDIPGTYAFEFQDGLFNDPALDNLIVIGGLAVGAPQGLGLNNGTFTIMDGGNRLVIEDATIPVGGCGPVRILMDNPSVEVQGFELAIQHDGGAVKIDSIDIDGTITEMVGAEVVAPDIDPLNGPGATLGVVLDFVKPFDGQVIPPGTGQHIANFVYCCNAPEPLTTELQFIAGLLGDPPLDNLIVVNGQSVIPERFNGFIDCAIVDQDFIRGDCNDDGRLDIADGIFILNFLFQMGTAPGCNEACDANDDDRLDMIDGQYVIQYRLLDGPPPPAPFPDCGTDPGSDCAVFDSCP